MSAGRVAAALALVALLATTLPADTGPTVETLERFRASHGSEWILTLDEISRRPRRLLGGAIDLLPESAAQQPDGARRAEAAIREFLDGNGELLGLDAQALDALRLVRDGVVTSRSGRQATVSFEIAPAGVPVVGARVTAALVRGSLVYVHVVGSAPVSTSPLPRIDDRKALDAVLARLPGATGEVSLLEPPRLAFLPEAGGHRLVYELSLVDTRAHRRWLGRVDARTAEVVLLEDATDEACAPVTGGPARRALGGVRPERADDAEREELLPFAMGGDAAAGRDGVFTAPAPPYDGGLRGSSVSDSCTNCTDPVQPLAPADVHGDVRFGEGGIDEAGNGFATPADRTAYFHAEGVHRQASRWQSVPFMAERTVVNVNVEASCNANYDGRSINFFRASDACANTGEIRDVVAHEWGHALDHHDGQATQPLSIDGASGEAAADVVAMLRSRDACIGESFHLDDLGPSATCLGVRDLDELSPGHQLGTPATLSTLDLSRCPPSAYYRGPLGKEGHCEGQIFGQAAWHLVQDLLTGRSYGSGAPLPSPVLPEDQAWDVAEQLFHDSRPLTATYAPSRLQSIGPSAYDAYLVADDEGDGLGNGTPHAAAIHDAFAHHGMEESGSPPTDAADCVGPADPAVTITRRGDDATGLPALVVSWTDVGARSHDVLRADDASDAFLPVGFAGAGAGSVVDRGVLPGRTYRYRVVARDAAGCMSPGAPTLPQGIGAMLRIADLRVSDPPPGGNGDGQLEEGETASVSVDLANDGGADARSLVVSLASPQGKLRVTGPPSLAYGTIAPGGTTGAPGTFQVTVDAGAPRFTFLVTSAESPDGCLRDAWTLEIRSRDPQLESWHVEDPPAGGDGNGAWHAGETVSLVVTLKDVGLLDATGVAATLSFDGAPPAGVTIVDPTATWPRIPADGTPTDSDAPHFRLQAAVSVLPRTRVPLLVSVTLDGAPHATFRVRPTVGKFAAPIFEWGGTTETWSTPVVVPMEDTDRDGAITACDLPAIVVPGEDASGRKGIFAFRGNGSGMFWSVVTSDDCVADTAACTLPQTALSGGDLDGDGTNEIVVAGADSQVTAYDSGGGILWTLPDPYVNGIAAPQIADLSADGTPDVIVGGSVIDAATGVVRWETPRAPGGRVLVADLDFDGQLEFITSTSNGDAFRDGGARYPAFFHGFDKYGAVADFDGEPFPEVAFVHGTTITIQDHEGTVLAERTGIPWGFAPGPPAAADLDGDGMAEVIFATDQGLWALHPDLTDFWTVPYVETTGMLAGCSLFDFDGDGRLEVIYRHDDGIAILDGRDGERLWELPAASPTLWETPVVADVDGDGSAELVLNYTRIGGGSNPFALQVYGNPAWPAARSVWNQENYSVTNVDPDGGLPRLPRPRWTVKNDYKAQDIPEACPCVAPPPTFTYAVPDCSTLVACFVPAGAPTDLDDLDDLTWDFGDGTPLEQGLAPCHEFAAEGQYAVFVTADADAACPREWGAVVTLATDLEADFEAVVPCLGEDTCVADQSDGGVSPREFLWDWGDGSPLETGDLVCHAWAAGGTYDITLFVRDANGCLAEKTLRVGIPDPSALPEVSASGSQPLMVRRVPEGLELTFEDNGLDTGVYKGFLQGLQSLGYTHALVSGACGVHGGLVVVPEPPSDSYYLVASVACDPRTEGPIGYDSFGARTPSSTELGQPACP